MKVSEQLAEDSNVTPSGYELPADDQIWDAGWPQTMRDYEQLVEVFQDRLVRHAYRFLGNIAEAEDVAQEVFVKAYADREQRKTVANVSAYLYRMAGNLARDVLRHRRRQSALVGDAISILEVPTHHPDAVRIAAAAEGIQRVESMLQQVSPDQAEVVRLRVLDEMPPRAIAQVLGCRVATVRSRLRYGMEKLREIVTREEEMNK